ncbi:MAG: hypothetical protein JWM27_4092 [Gemmatimonadetes bacterium]|nr:hypothetical protein [Gemmatimonadota bacterium]
MLLTFAALLALHGAAPADTIPRDSARRQRSVTVGVGPARRNRPLTPELLASAYRDPAARETIARARAARLAQDSSIRSYDARGVQRISVGMGLREGARGRLLYRGENAWRVRWQRGVGAHVDVLGSRAAIPMVGRAPRLGENDGEAGIPYFPGREGLLFFAGMQRVGDTTGVMLVHPLDAGSESAYRFSSGDSAGIRLPDGTRVRLVEVRVEARRPEPDLLVGSLWFDASSGQLVRAGFRPAAPFDLATTIRDDGDKEGGGGTPLLLRAVMNPLRFTSDGFFVEYGLHGGRWWMPHSQGMEGLVRAGPMRMPIRVEERFDYADVNGTMALAPIVLPAKDSAAVPPGTTHSDSMRLASGAKRRARTEGCKGGQASRTFTTKRYGSVPVEVTVPCDTLALINSPELPGSIYQPDEELFGSGQRQELEKALGFGLQAGWSPGTPVLTYGVGGGLLRYNRVEGLAPAVRADEALGRGYAAHALLRVGLASPTPTGELGIERSAGTRSFGVNVYRRLDTANDWGDPLGLGASLSALLFGRDEGFYYRAMGAELTGRRGESFRWRLFGERQTEAEKETDFSVANLLGGDGFTPNIRARRGTIGGIGLDGERSWGLRPGGFHLASATHAEAAAGDFRYARGMADATVTRGLGKRLDGALTLGAGTSAGDLPPQRLWYLGGAYSVRGQPAGASIGNAFWLARAELGGSFAAARPVVFYDIGWAGARSDFVAPVHAIQGAGVGASLFDGMVRFDLSRGIDPRRGFRLDAYLEARF